MLYWKGIKLFIICHISYKSGSMKMFFIASNYKFNNSKVNILNYKKRSNIEKYSELLKKIMVLENMKPENLTFKIILFFLFF